MNKDNFNLATIKTLSPVDAKKTIDKYFIPLTDGNHAFLINGKYEVVEEKVIKKTYFNRMPVELSNYYFKEKVDLKTIAYDVNKPTFYEDYINMCPKIKQTYQEYKTFSNETKEKVEYILNHILEIYCSGKKDSYEFLLKWFANAIKGNRNDSALYLKGPQGAGKSSIVDDFMRHYVIGLNLSHQGGAEPLKNHFNSVLSGKLWVLFEELETMSKSEWMSVSCVLKRQITSKTLQIERKGKETVEETNLNNYILLSNNDAIQDDDGRRYFILDISPKRINDKAYFKKLHSCFNDDVGKAFYSYLMEIDLKDYNAQNYPLTQSKLDSYSKRLDNVFKYLKDEYILQNKEINKVVVNDLHIDYKLYCVNNGIKPKHKIEFNNTLKSVGINYYGSGSKNLYTVSLETLKTISDKFHWIHDLDEITETKKDLDKKTETKNDLDYGVEDKKEELTDKQKDKIISNLEAEIEELKRKLKELEKSKVNKSIKQEEKQTEEFAEEDIDDILNFLN